MKKRIRVSKYTKQILDILGGPTKAINKMLDLCEKGEVNYFNKPDYYISQNEYVTLNVDITSPWFYNICLTYDLHNRDCSLANFIEWFCTEEIYTEYEFNIVYKQDEQLNEVISYCDKLVKLLNIVQIPKSMQEHCKKLTSSILEFYNAYGKECNTKNKT